MVAALSFLISIERMGTDLQQRTTGAAEHAASRAVVNGKRRLHWCDPDRPASPGWSFDDLTRSYNFPHASDRVQLFLSVIASEAAAQAARNGPIRGLDIGCGKGIGLYPEATLSLTKCFDDAWGIEPDVMVEQPRGAFSRVINGTLESADLPRESVDVAYSYMVMEHVEDPVKFFRAIGAALKPGGTYTFLTVNGWHYFTLLADAMRRLRLDEIVLRRLVGKESVESYHYATRYRCNTASQLRAACAAAGLCEPELAFVERGGRLGYLPGMLDIVRRVGDAKRVLVQQKQCLLELFCRVRKPG